MPKPHTKGLALLHPKLLGLVAVALALAASATATPLAHLVARSQNYTIVLPGVDGGRRS
jgi:hypothetical protein